MPRREIMSINQIRAEERKQKRGRPLGEVLSEQLVLARLPEPEAEYMFHEPYAGEKQRRWRFDLAYPNQRIAIEIEGGTYTVKCGRCKGEGWTPTGGKCTGCKGSGRAPGGHTNVKGIRSDIEKYNTAACQGWKLFRVLADDVRRGNAIGQLLPLLSRLM